jgi:hypothetical protein
VASFISLREEIGEALRDGDRVAMVGFTHPISPAAGHEAIHSGRKGPARVRADLQVSCERNYSLERLAWPASRLALRPVSFSILR